MGTFGYVDKGGTATLTSVVAIKTVFTCPVACTATEIHCYVYNSHATNAYDVNIAIYSGNDRLVTKTVSVPALYNDWLVFDIDDTVLVAVDYGLSFKGKSAGSSLSFYYAAGSANQTHVDTGLAVADDCPNPFVDDSFYARKYSIHCDYTEAGGAPKGSNLVNTMTTLLNSKMLYG